MTTSPVRRKSLALLLGLACLVAVPGARVPTAPLAAVAVAQEPQPGPAPTPPAPVPTPAPAPAPVPAHAMIAGPDTVAPGLPFYLDARGSVHSEARPLRWKWKGGGGQEPVYLKFDMTDNPGAILFVPQAMPGFTYRFLLIAESDTPAGVDVDADLIEVEVRDPNPPPPPPPPPIPDPEPLPPVPAPPGPTPTPGAFSGVVVYETAKPMPAKQGNIFLSTKVREYLKSHVAKGAGGAARFRWWDDDYAPEALASQDQALRDLYMRALADHGQDDTPWVVLQAPDGSVTSKPFPADADAMIELLKSVGGN
jgi:hypothetical protein